VGFGAGVNTLEWRKKYLAPARNQTPDVSKSVARPQSDKLVKLILDECKGK
jgi:hypothetical protein